MARRRPGRWTPGDVIAGALGILGGVAGLWWFAGWVTADLGRFLFVASGAGVAVSIWLAICLIRLLGALLGR